MQLTNNVIVKKTVAILLAILTVLNSMQMLPVAVIAATSAHPATVTITIKDQAGLPVKGASIEFNIDSAKNGKKYEKGTKDTDGEGTVEVLSAEKYVDGDLTIDAKVSKSGYETATVASQKITSEDQNIKVTLHKLKVEGITVTPATEKYDGTYRDAVKVTGDKAGDKVTYKLGDQDWTGHVPQIREIGTYEVSVKVERDGYEAFEKTVTAKIEKGVIALDVETEHNYTDAEQELITIKSGLEPGDLVTYKLGDGEFSTSSPKRKDVGSYSITIKIHRNENYADFEKTYTAKINAVDIDNLSAELYSGTYDGNMHEAVTDIKGKKDGDKIEYKLNDGAWSQTNPKVVDAGEYKVQIRVTRTNYNVTTIQTLKPRTVIISKKKQPLAFNVKEYSDKSHSVVTYEGKNIEFDFSASGNIAGEPIEYSIEKGDDEDHTAIEDIATFNTSTGKLIVKSGGHFIRVIASTKGNTNYEDATIEYGLNIQAKADGLLKFDKSSITYTVSTNAEISSAEAKKTATNDYGTVTYALDDENEEGVEDAISVTNDGKVTVINYQKLFELLDGKENIEVTVTATKTEGKRHPENWWFWWKDKDETVFPAATASYTISIKYAGNMPQDIYEISEAKGNAADENSKWYLENPEVTVKDSTKYEIAWEFKDNKPAFADRIELTTEGKNTYTVYACDKNTGEIYKPEIIGDVSLDKSLPYDITISYAETEENKSLFDEIKAKVEAIFFKKVTVTFSAKDDVSGVEKFDWSYNRDENVSDSNLDKTNGTVKAIEVENETGEIIGWTGTVELPKDDVKLMRGKFSVKVTDKAGNEIEKKTEEEPTVVVDQISPEVAITHSSTDQKTSAKKVDEHYYYPTDVKCEVAIKETNFDNADKAQITIEKDGKPYTALEVNGAGKWKADEDKEHKDQYTNSFTLTDDGDYVIDVTYTDPSGNQTRCTSETITIDETVPIIDFTYADYNDSENAQTATLTILEHNFRASDLKLAVEAKDINGNDIADKEALVSKLNAYLHDSANWDKDNKKNPDLHSIKIAKEFADAIYQLTFKYADLAGNEAAQCESGEFIVDRTAPAVEKMSISYSTPVLQKIISGITFGYYQYDVIVTFKAEDPISGVERFNWFYTRETSASSKNVETYEADNQTVEAVQDEKDKSVFTASITLPKEKADQLRGNIGFTATDRYKNTKDGLTDTKNIIVVDTIAPKMQVSYTKANNSVGTTSYYNKPVTATFTVDEANFYKEDVKISVIKDDVTQELTPAQLNWADETADESKDLHIATYTLAAPADHSGDGDYRFHVEYTDRSNNKMTEYTSDLLVIDTINPVIKVAYANKTPKNTLKDSDGHNRAYYDKTQTATVTITEHNFAAKDVDFKITAKDVTGKAIDLNKVSRKSAWTDNGDVHTITITYPGDANYIFDIAYADLATNKAADYKKDYFTVDKTAPKNLKVEYSKSVLDTVLSKVTFGFYDAKMKVTISADDDVSGVHAFDYSYLKAAGVSSVNAQLVNQAIKEAQITFSNGGKTGTAKFDIPKAALGKHNQFNGTVEFTATDRAENTSDKLKAKKRVVVDNIAPTASVEYNTPVKTVNGIAYYDGTITATVNVNEANFYAEDVKVSVKKDGKAYNVKPNWSNRGTDTHIGTFTLTEDGDYFVTIEYSDKSGNKMITYTSDQLTIDTKIEAPVITVNGEDGNGKAYKDNVVPAVTFSDTNFESYQIKLTRTRYNKKDEDVTATYIGNAMHTNGQGGSGTFDTFKKVADTDGIYTLTVSMADKAGHQSEATTVFTVNRFGSVYVYGDYLTSLIKDGGTYVQETKEDLIITEYNADRLVAGSLRIDVSRDGKPLDDVKYTVAPEINDTVAVGSSGWYQYQYTIDKANFAADGVYKISVSSKDATGNAPETTNYEDQNILFRVDATAPEITSITGLEESIVDAQNVTVNYTAYDTIGLASIDIIVNGKTVETITDFADDLSNYAGSFVIDEQNGAQSVQIVVKDLAGNITDTSTEAYKDSCAYVFHDEITVSTNAFALALAWIQQHVIVVIAGIAAIAAVIGFLIFLIGKRRKKKEEK